MALILGDVAPAPLGLSGGLPLLCAAGTHAWDTSLRDWMNKRFDAVERRVERIESLHRPRPAHQIPSGAERFRLILRVNPEVAKVLKSNQNSKSDLLPHREKSELAKPQIVVFITTHRPVELVQADFPSN